MDELRREVSTLREFVVQQSKEIVKLKRQGRGVEAPEQDEERSDRLADIEIELMEQKRSTAKITKLCLAAIKALERLEDKPLQLGSELGPSSPDTSSLNRQDKPEIGEGSLV